MLLLGVKQWLGRPAPGGDVAMPKRMAAIDSLTAGLDIGGAALATGQVVVVVAIFTVIAGSTVLVPVVGNLVASARLAGPLAHLRTWLVADNAAIMAVLLTVIGVVMVGKGIGSF